MIPDDQPTFQPSDFNEIIDDKPGKSNQIKKTFTTFDTTNNTLPSSENLTTNEENNNEKTGYCLSYVKIP